MKLFRPSAEKPLRYRLFCTLLQTALMWGVFLFLLPAFVVWMQTRIGAPYFEPGAWRTIAVVVFWLAGCSGLFCGWLFVKYGEGTPFPLDETTKLVILGPYRYVRNPMAMLGILQGVMVGLYLGSWPAIVYALCGVLAWHWLARPYEEADLLHRHGEAFDDYARRVRCWIPNLKPYDETTP